MQKSKQLAVFPADGGFRITRRVSLQQAQMLEAMEVMRPEYDTVNGELRGFRVIGIETRRVDSDLRSIRAGAGISMSEIEMNIGSSRTSGLREEARLELIKAGHFPEDKVERTQAKVRVYVHVGAAKGDILRAWPRSQREIAALHSGSGR